MRYKKHIVRKENKTHTRIRWAGCIVDTQRYGLVVFDATPHRHRRKVTEQLDAFLAGMERDE